MADEDYSEIDADDEGVPLFDISGDLHTFYDTLIIFARDHGCTCMPRVFVAEPFPEYVGMKLQHQRMCQGMMRANRGMN